MSTTTLSNDLTVLHTAIDPRLGEVSHADPDCPRLVGIPAVTTHRPDDPQRGWLCSACIEVAPRRSFQPGDATTTRADSVDRPAAGATAAPGEGRQGHADPRAYTWTKVEDIWAVRVPAGAHSTGDVVTVSKKSGETREVTLGRQVAAAGTRGQFDSFAEANTVDDCYRWTQVRGQWLVQGPTVPAPALGVVVTICKRDGSSKQGRIVLECGDADNGKSLYEVEEVKAEAPAAPTAAAAPAAPARTGRSLKATLLALRDKLVAETGSQTRDRTIRVCVPASVLDVPDQPDAAYRISWAYAWKGAERHTGGVGTIRTIPLGDDSTIKLAEYLLGLDAAGLAEAMAAYGRHFHSCGRCGSPLTDKDSKARGLGPDCARKGA